MTTERRKASGFLHDERGSKSMGRLLLVCALVFTGVLILVDALLPGVDVPDPAYVLLGTIFTGLLAWVGVPRAAQQLGGVASGIAAAKRTGPTGGSSVAVTFKPHEWADGDPQEGLG